MPRLPTVAIIGKPNTGKSTLFNRLYGRRKAIVSEVPGTTRDHVAGRVEAPIPYLLVDTGGMGRGTEDKELEDDVHAQSLLALEHADLILFTINSRDELTASDFEIADLLRKKRKNHVPVILVPTKCDNPEATDEVLPRAYEFGIAESVIPVSATHRIGIDDLQTEIEKLLASLHFQAQEEEKSTSPHIAIVGKPNVGKSSFVNALMSDTQRERSALLVSDLPGTTRDAVDITLKYQTKEFIFIDTAGLHRHRKDEPVAALAELRSIRALEMADIVVLIVDAHEPVSKHDKRIASMAVEEGKGLIILLNKIDLVPSVERPRIVAEARSAFAFCRFAPLLPCSAKTRSDIIKIFDLITLAHESRTRRITTKALHEWYQDAVEDKPLGTLSKTKHLTQAEDIPPTFVLFVRDPKQVQLSQLRYLENTLRKTFGFEGTPVRWITKAAR